MQDVKDAGRQAIRSIMNIKVIGRGIVAKDRLAQGNNRCHLVLGNKIVVNSTKAWLQLFLTRALVVMGGDSSGGEARRRC